MIESSGTDVSRDAVPRPAPDQWVALAVVGRPHGVRGEVRAHPFEKSSALLLELDEVLVRFVDGARAGEEHEIAIDHARGGNDAILLKLHGVDDRDQAAAIRGVHLCARRGAFPILDEGEFYACDIAGAEVLGPDGARVGTVRELATYPSVDTLMIEASDGGAFEVPLVDAFVETVDVDGGRVVLRTLDVFEKT